MLDEMRIRGLGVIHDATLPFAPGLTVLTGETGAGKTMVVTGLAMLLGGRVAAGAVRHGEKAARVEGRFRLPCGSAPALRAEDAGAQLDPIQDDDTVELLVGRTLSSSGRTRAQVGGSAVPVGVLAELADDLVTVHGQSEQLLLRSAARQREVLDTYAGAGVAGLLEDYRTTFRRRGEVAAELDQVVGRARERAQEADMLRAALEQIEKADPKPGEDKDLTAEFTRLSAVEELRAAAVRARGALAEDDSASGVVMPHATGLLDDAYRSLDAVAGTDPQLAELAGMLREISFTAAEVVSGLSSYLAGLDADPGRLEFVLDRRAELTTLTRKYADDIDAVLEWGGRAAVRLATLDDDDELVARLRGELDELDRELRDRADALHRERLDAAGRLSQAVRAELTALAMPNAQLLVDVEAGRMGPHGADEIAFRLRAHSGAAADPLAKGASGGELSRVMLALEVVLAAEGQVPAFVFDEVDSGVGGRAATEIGRRLAKLARHAQVIVVTHLPQVAAFADQHLLVDKSDDGQVTSTDVRALNKSERVKELARMLAGQEESRSARAHAKELLEMAKVG